MPVIRQIVKDAAAKDNRISALILGIVKSRTFQRNQVANALTASR
jgi:hypothetical protein